VIQPRDWKDPFLVSVAKIQLQSSLPPPPVSFSVPPTAQQKATLTRVYKSGPQMSGPGAEFSSFYSLCSQDGDVPSDFTIESESFSIVGDRSCGSWATCTEETKTPRQVCWKFRMQGHSEWGPFNSGQGKASSEGILTVVWATK
jgi:hypothetical protein